MKFYCILATSVASEWHEISECLTSVSHCSLSGDSSSVSLSQCDIATAETTMPSLVIATDSMVTGNDSSGLVQSSSDTNVLTSATEKGNIPTVLAMYAYLTVMVMICTIVIIYSIADNACIFIVFRS